MMMKWDISIVNCAEDNHEQLNVYTNYKQNASVNYYNNC